MAFAYIGIGSNLGNREEYCLCALSLLSEEGIIIRKRSSLYETKPWGVKDQPNFINLAAEVETDLKPLELLKVLRDVEKRIGKQETYKWGPRVIDLDILFYDDLIVDEPSLRIPHPHMHKRDFVLRPLAEIAPDKIHPLLKKTVKQLLDDLRRDRGAQN